MASISAQLKLQVWKINKTIQNFFGKKSAPFFWPVNVNGEIQWQMGDFRAYVAEGFNLNAIIYSAIMYKVRAGSQVRMRAYIGDPENPEALGVKHPLSKLALRPNPMQSFQEFHGLITTYLNISGNAYIFLDREGKFGGIPKAMYNLRPDRVFIIPEKSTIKGYLYRPDYMPAGEGIPILPEDLIHVKFPNPSDKFEGLGYGMSPITPMAQSGDIDNQVTKFLKVFFDRGALPAGLLKYNTPLEDDDVKRIKSKWREVYGGVNNWGDVGVLDSVAEYQKIGYSFDEMGFQNIDDRNESRLLGPFGVPPILIGSRFGLEHATYENYKEARRAFWEDTMNYELTLEQEDFRYYLKDESEEAFIGFDTSKVYALQTDVPEMVNAADKLFRMGVPANRALYTVGLKVESVPAGDVPFVDGSVIAIDEQGRPLVTPSIAQPKELLKKAGYPQDSKKKDRVRQSEAIDEIAEGQEPDYMIAAKQCFEKDKRAILAIVNKAKNLAKQNKSTINWNAIKPDILNYLSGESEATWASTFVPLIEGSVNDAGNFWSVELGIQFDVRNLLAEDWFQRYTLQFAQPINKTTSRNVTNLIGQGMEEGWTIQQMQNNISTTFEQWAKGEVDPARFQFLNIRTQPYRAEMIARTETIRAMNAGSMHLFEDWGCKKKEWSAANDGRTRTSHKRADGQVVAIDESFNVGGYEMDYPGDASHGAPGKEFINCRCAVLPVIEDEDELHETENQISNNNRTYTNDSSIFREINNDFEREWEARAILLKQNNEDGYNMLSKYTGTRYRAINGALRSGNIDETIQNEINLINNSMVKIGENVRVWRGVDDWKTMFPNVNSVSQLVGTGFTELGFMSTTSNKEVAEGVINGSNLQRRLLMRIEVDSNVNGFYAESLTRNKGEFELILENNTSWIISDTSIEQIDGNEVDVITIRRAK